MVSVRHEDENATFCLALNGTFCVALNGTFCVALNVVSRHKQLSMFCVRVTTTKVHSPVEQMSV
jgi:hypothetical protein